MYFNTGELFTKKHKHYRLIKTGKYIQKSLRPSREVWLTFDGYHLMKRSASTLIKRESRECGVEVIFDNRI